MATTITFNTPTILRNLADAEQSTDATSVSVVGSTVSNALNSNSNLSLSAANNITLTANAGNITLGNVANLKIAGGSNGQVLQTDGTGNLVWTAQTSGSPAGLSGQLQTNGGNGTFGASSNLSFLDNANGGTLTVQNIFASDIFGNMTIRAPIGTIVFSGGSPNNFIISANGIFMGDVSKVKVTGGTSGQLLSSAGNADLQFVNPVTPGGTDTQLQFNDKGAFAGVTGVTWNGNTLNLGNVANLSITGGSNAQVLSTNGNGVLSWATPQVNTNIGATAVYSFTGTFPGSGFQQWPGTTLVTSLSNNVAGLKLSSSPSAGYWTNTDTVPITYQVSFSMIFTGPSVGQVASTLRKYVNVSTQVSVGTCGSSNSAGDNVAFYSGTIVLQPGEAMFITVFNTGGAGTVTFSQMTITRVG